VTPPKRGSIFHLATVPPIGERVAPSLVSEPEINRFQMVLTAKYQQARPRFLSRERL
jgi:hypothetical protein